VNEVERIAELEEEGMDETPYRCPHCGAMLMGKKVELTGVFEGLIEYTVECPSCGYKSVMYDDLHSPP